MKDNNLRTVHLTIGDWSKDGHGIFEKCYFMVNADVSSIREAYKNSCRLTKLQFNHGEDYIHNKTAVYDEPYMMLSEFEDGDISPENLEILKSFGITDEKDRWGNILGAEEQDYDDDGTTVLTITEAKDAALLIMRFIALSMPESFEWHQFSPDSEPVNGFWNGQLDGQFGYGIYD